MFLHSLTIALLTVSTNTNCIYWGFCNVQYQLCSLSLLEDNDNTGIVGSVFCKITDFFSLEDLVFLKKKVHNISCISCTLIFKGKFLSKNAACTHAHIVCVWHFYLHTRVGI
jgi:hypothetical protein